MMAGESNGMKGDGCTLIFTARELSSAQYRYEYCFI